MYHLIKKASSRDRSVDTTMGYSLEGQYSILGKDKKYFLLIYGTSDLLSTEYQGLFAKSKVAWGMKLTT